VNLSAIFGRERWGAAARIAAVAIFEPQSRAEEAVQKLKRSGFDMERIFMCHRLLSRRLLVAACCSLFWPAATALGAEAGSPNRIAREVRHELVTLPGYRVFDYLTYRTDGSKVTLFGQVTRPIVKSDAEKAVKSIEGVTSVDNEIEVLPQSQSDDRIRIAVYNALYSKAPLQKYQMGAVPPIHIIVKNHNVTLEGVVSSVGDKDLAGLTAKGVSGVLKLTNNLSPLSDGSGILAGLGGVTSIGDGQTEVPESFLNLVCGLHLG
jgi:hyperosmotically inducible protein